MHTRSLVQVFSFAVIVTVGVIWIKSRATATDLQARLSALTTARRHTSQTLEQERDRLRSALAEADLRRQAAAMVTPPAPIPLASPPAVVAPWPLGVWRSSREWRNEGHSTPRGTVATLLWAAAGGDLTAMMPLIAFDEASRNRAQALFDALPPADRQAFPTPEALVAGLTIQAVPASTAQLSWFHQRDADHATVGVFLGGPAQSAPTEVRMVPAQDNNPPMLIDTHANKLTVLSLQRSSQGWRVVIPAAAIENLARQSQTRLMSGLDYR
jgi:hypothetical protein